MSNDLMRRARGKSTCGEESCRRALDHRAEERGRGLQGPNVTTGESR